MSRWAHHHSRPHPSLWTCPHAPRRRPPHPLVPCGRKCGRRSPKARRRGQRRGRRVISRVEPCGHARPVCSTCSSALRATSASPRQPFAYTVGGHPLSQRKFLRCDRTEVVVVAEARALPTNLITGSLLCRSKQIQRKRHARLTVRSCTSFCGKAAWQRVMIAAFHVSITGACTTALRARRLTSVSPALRDAAILSPRALQRALALAGEIISEVRTPLLLGLRSR